MKHQFVTKEYETRIDQFRVREGIGLREWADAADVLRTQLNRYRAAQATAHVDNLARLVKAASVICGRKVRASEVMDLGEDEPVAPNKEYVGISEAWRRITYPSRLDTLMRRLGIPQDYLAKRARISKPTLRKIRSGSTSPFVTTVEKLVRTFRRMGYEVTASDVIDVGED